MEDIPTLVLLLYNGMDPMSKDELGRLPLHYAAMRGLDEVINLLLIDPSNTSLSEIDTWKKNNDTRDALKLKSLLPVRQLLCKDKYGQTPISLAALRPRILSTYLLISSYMERYGLKISSDIARLSDPLAIHGEENGNGNEGDINHSWRYCHLNPNFNSLVAHRHYHNLERIDRWDSSELTSRLFRQNYFHRQRPVLIANQLTAGQKIWAFRDKAAFLERYGAIKIQYVDGQTEGNVAEFIRQCMNDDDDETSSNSKFLCRSLTVCKSESDCRGSVLTDTIDRPCRHAVRGALTEAVSYIDKKSLLAGLFEGDLIRPSIFDLCGDNDKEPVILSLGPAGAGMTPFQSGDSSWTVVLIGKVHYLIAAPGQLDYILVLSNLRCLSIAYRAYTGKGVQLKELESELNQKFMATSEWMDEMMTRISLQNETAYSVVVGAGNVLFIPQGWHFIAQYLTDSVVADQKFCSITNTVILHFRR